MPSLRQHARDAAIGAVSQKHLEYVADLLQRRAAKLRHPVLKWFYADRSEALTIELLAATFARVRGVPEPVPDQFDAQVRIAFERNEL